MKDSPNSRKEKVANLIKELSAIFLEREKNKISLITVTSCNVSPDLKYATIFITVIPDEKESDALNFAKRKRGELRTYIKKNIQIKNTPLIDIQIDKGEKNRQKIDELLQNG